MTRQKDNIGEFLDRRPMPSSAMLVKAARSSEEEIDRRAARRLNFLPWVSDLIGRERDRNCDNTRLRARVQLRLHCLSAARTLRGQQCGTVMDRDGLVILASHMMDSIDGKIYV